MSCVRNFLETNVPHYSKIIKTLRRHNITNDIFITDENLLEYLGTLIQDSKKKWEEAQTNIKKHKWNTRLYALIALRSSLIFEIQILGGWDARDYNFDCLY